MTEAASTAPEECDDCKKPATHRIEDARGYEVAVACAEDVWRHMRRAIPIGAPEQGDYAQPAVVEPGEYVVLPGQVALSKVPRERVLLAALQRELRDQIQPQVLINAAGMFKPRLAGVPCTRDNFAQVLHELGIERPAALAVWERLRGIDAAQQPG